MDQSSFECFNYAPQEFLVCVTVHKARNLCILNSDTYIKVTLDKNHKTTSIFQNSENPFFNEYFVFELFCTLSELLRLTILFEVYKRSCCKKDVNIGELFIDLTSIWNQSGHSYYKKWGKLENPLGQTTDMLRGHLQLDLSIVSRTEPPVPAILHQQDYENIENNLLQPDGETDTLHNIRYVITFFRGTFMKKMDYLIQITFAGMNGKTKIRKNTTNPEWNEEISFTWFYPSLCNIFLIQIMIYDCLQWKCICDYEIHSDNIVFSGTTPSLGPTYLHFYDNLQPDIYIGRILMSIETERIQNTTERISRLAITKSIQTLEENKFWGIESFEFVCLIWQGDFIHSTASNIKFNMKCGEWSSDTIECFLHSYDGYPKYKYFRNETPHRVAVINGFLPDYRLKYVADYILTDLLQEMKKHLINFKLFRHKYFEDNQSHAKCLKAIVLIFQEKLHRCKDELQYNGFKELTTWDTRRFQFLHEFMENFLNELNKFKKMLKSSEKNVLTNIDKVYIELLNKINQIGMILLERIQDNWPDLILTFSHNNKTIGNCKLNPRNFMFSQRSDCRANLCGKRQNIIIKPVNCMHTCTNCGCIFGKIDAWIWIGTELESPEYCHADGWDKNEHLYYDVKKETYFKCDLYIHQAKIRPGYDKTGLCDAKIRATLLNLSQETKTIEESLSPIWNEVIIFENLKLPSSLESYKENPPLICLEIFDVDTKKTSDYMGCGFIRPTIKSLAGESISFRKYSEMKRIDFENQLQQQHEPKLDGIKKMYKTKTTVKKLNELNEIFPPPLKWISLSNDGVTNAEILVSAVLIELSEIENSSPSIVHKIEDIPKEICPTMKKFKFEITFAGLRNYQKSSFRTSGKYKIKVMFAELSLYSGASAARIGESINFLDLYSTGFVNLPEELEYWPSIILTHIDCSRPNCEITIGAAMLSKSDKYLQVQHVKCDIVQSATVTFTDDNIDGYSNEEHHPLLETNRESVKSHKFYSHFKIMLKNRFKRNSKSQDEEELTTFRLDEDDYNWWTKFYNSIQETQELENSDKKKHHLVIFGNELENQSEFNYFQDWSEPIHLIRGIERKQNCPPKQQSYCLLKCHINIKCCEKSLASSSNNINMEYFQSEISNKFHELTNLMNEIPITVRVYIVQGLQIRSRDAYSYSDSFVKLQFGKHKINDRANYIPNQANPIFGKSFQLEGIIPREHILHISVYDHDFCDDLIGCTCIDLEDRLRTKHRATIGLANEYNRTGYNIWRDNKTPYEILKQFCTRYNLGPPIISGNRIEIADMIFEDSTEISKDELIEERLALSVLKKFDKIPNLGYKLVPEHVETRSLFRSDRPGIEQGKLQLWIEIYDPSVVPPPIDITPIPPKLYELRVIIWNTSDVILEEKNIFGKKMSDIYIKCWLDDIDSAQYSDVHYRSLNGEGNFNWRMIFTLKYSKTEDMMIVIKKAAAYEQFDTEIKLPPVLYVQIWDNDNLSPDDFLGALNINLSHSPEPTSSAKNCSLNENPKYCNLFTKRKIKGWFPAKGHLKDNIIGVTGKIELELEVLSEMEALAKPVGLGRDGPNALAPPNRPDTSFNWFSNPLKSIKHIIVPQLKRFCCYLLIGFLIVALILGIVYSIPGNTLQGLTNLFRF